MQNTQSSNPNLTQLLQYSPDELSSGVLIANWIQSKSSSGSLVFDLSQIEPSPKDSVTKYLNWVCLNAKVFNKFGILLNSSQINNFIEGKSTEIYIILKQLHDKIRERTQSKPSIQSTKSAPSPSIPNDKSSNVQKIQSTTSLSAQRRRINHTTHVTNTSSAIALSNPIASVLTSPPPQYGTNMLSQSKSTTNYRHQQNRTNNHFASLSLAISPTISHDRIEKVGTFTHSNDQNNNAESKDIGSNIVIGTIKEQEADDAVRDPSQPANPLSLLSPDLKDVIAAPTTPDTLQFRPHYSDPITTNPPTNAFEQFGDHIVYDGIKLSGQNIEDFVNEKEKLENKLNDAMASYERNNAQYLHNIVEQYRNQKLHICQGISDQMEQNNFLQKLQRDLELLDESLKQQFAESKKTLYNQLTAIHSNRLKEFAIKLNKKAPVIQTEITQEEEQGHTLKASLPMELETSVNVNNQNINIPTQPEQDEDDGLNETLKEVSSLLEKCWKSQLNKQQKQRNDKEKEIETLKEILSVYQNLSKLIQLQSNTLKTTIIDFQNLCHENGNELQSVGSTQNTSPDKMRIPFDKYDQVPSNTQIELLSSADTILKPYYQPYTSNEDHVMSLKSGNGRKKRRKSWNKKSTKNSAAKTPAFSFVDPKYNRQTVSSHNKKVSGKKKLKRSKKSK